MEQEYASRAATTRNNMTLLRGSIDRVAVAIGNALLPGINAVLEQLRPWISHMAQMISDNPQLVRGIVIAGAAFTALRAAVFAATVATRVLGVAFAATPIGLIAAGIAAAAGLIVANWEKVGPFFSALWELIKAYTTPFMEFIKSVFGWAPLALIIKNWEPIVGWFKGLWDRVSPYLEPLLKLFGGGDGESLTVRVQRLADEQKARNSVAGGSGALVQANAVQVAQGVQAAREQAFGVSPEALLRAATPLPAPGGLLRASGQLPEPGLYCVNRRRWVASSSWKGRCGWPSITRRLACVSSR